MILSPWPSRSVALVLLLSLMGCVASTPTPVVECRPTLAYMTPPAEVSEFFVRGSSEPNAAREALGTANWYGNDALWVILPKNGELAGRLDDKIPPYRLKPGRADWSARRLDGNRSVPSQPVGPDGYGDRGFQAGGVSFPEPGCWEVTYSLEGRDPLRFVLLVR